jgi:glutaryl-CoA dehydrogenase
MYPVAAFGDEAQQERFLPQLAAGKKIGCFALTEPGAGSNPAEMSATAEEANGGYVINGVKTWISNAPIADVFILWAKSAAHGGKTRGFVFERSEAKGMQTPAILGKLGMRASATGEAIFSQTWLPKEALLPKAEGIKAALSCLTRARFGICWGAMGAAEACWHVARDYGMQRRQFGKPIAQTQLFQQKLANMQTNIALGLCAALRLGRLMDSGKIMPEAVSMLKRNNAAAALAIARDARDMLGGNGMADSMPVMRHAQNLEAVNTYEGTQDMHSLILGRAQTGLSAF